MTDTEAQTLFTNPDFATSLDFDTRRTYNKEEARGGAVDSDDDDADSTDCVPPPLEQTRATPSRTIYPSISSDHVAASTGTGTEVLWGDWPCEACTFINTAGTTVCSLCDTMRSLPRATIG